MQMAGTELMRIANLHKMEVIVDVNENDIIRVKLGDTALIEVDAYLEEKFKGVVTEIANSANVAGTSTDQVTNFVVKILILRESYEHLIPENKPNHYPFRPGMSATVDIQTNTVYDVLAIPIQSVTTRADLTGIVKDDSKEGVPEGFEVDEDKKGEDGPKEEVKMNEVVFVFKDNKVYQKEVKTGIQDNKYIEIKEGITDEDEVVIAPYSAISKKLKDDLEVEKVKQDDLFKDKK